MSNPVLVGSRRFTIWPFGIRLAKIPKEFERQSREQSSVNSESGMIMQAGHGLQVDRAEKAPHPQDEPTLKVKATQFAEWVRSGKGRQGVNRRTA